MGKGAMRGQAEPAEGVQRPEVKHDHPSNVIYSPVCPACQAEWDAAPSDETNADA